jgi:hypothetical protein
METPVGRTTPFFQLSHVQGTLVLCNSWVSGIAHHMLVMQVPVKVPTSRQETGHGEKKSASCLRRQKRSQSIMILALSAVFISKAFS